MIKYSWLEIFLLGVIAFCLGAMIVMATGCKTVEYRRGPLSDQLLRPLPGHTGLVNTECVRDEKTHACVYNYVEYDLSDAPTRLRLRDAGFICNVNGKQYRVAQELPGLIYERHKKNCFLMFCGTSTDEVIDFIPITDYQKLLDANTECASIFVYKDEQ